MKHYSLVVLFLFTYSCTQLSTKDKRLPSNGTVRILHIGDSQTKGPFGKLLFDHLSTRGNEVHVLGVSSSSPRHWASVKGERASNWLCKQTSRYNDSTYKSHISMKDSLCLDRLPNESVFKKSLDSYRPDLVIFQFLGNSMGRSQKKIKKSIHALLNTLSDEQGCIFITSPPYYKDLVERNKKRAQTHSYFLDALSSFSDEPRCDVIEGFKMPSFSSQSDYFYTIKNGKKRGDGMHFNKKGARRYLDYIIDYLP